MDIRVDAPYPICVLSNLYPNIFTFRGVRCNSMEGLLQAFKFPDIDTQLDFTKLIGFDARKRGEAGNGWKRAQQLWWMGTPYDRQGPEYQALLNEAYFALSQNFSFQEALLATGNGVFTHRAGREDPHKTILTRIEFVSRVTALRQELLRKQYE